MYIIVYFSILFFILFCIYCYRGYFRLTEKSLDKQKLFWAALIIPLLSCLYFGIPVWWNYSVDISENGYAYFLKISTLPLYILASAPILAAFVANTHRTKQTEKQIIEAEKKNKVDIYIAKRKYMYEQISNMKTIDNGKISNPPLLCFEALLNNNFVDIKNDDFIKGIRLLFTELNKILIELNEYKFPEESMFLDEYKECVFMGREIYRIHPFDYLDRQLKKIKNFIYVKYNNDNTSLLIYQVFIDAITDIRENKKGNIVIDGEIYLFTSENKIIMNDFIKKMIEILDDFLKFTYGIISIIYMESDVNQLLPIMKVSKEICEEWKVVIREM